MITIRRVIRGVLSVGIIIVGGLYPSRMHAQQQARGEFNLSQKVHWGATVLPAGEYTYSVESERDRAVVHVGQKGGTFSGLFVPRTFSRTENLGPDRIILKRVGVDMFVADLHLQSLDTELEFTVPPVAGSAVAQTTTIVPRSAPASDALLTIINPKHQNVSSARVEKIYMSACEAVERELNWSTTIRPRLVVYLGSAKNVLRFPNTEYGEVHLKKWDDYRFAEAIVQLTLYKLVPLDERARLSDLAVDRVDATVNLCELKKCVN